MTAGAASDGSRMAFTKATTSAGGGGVTRLTARQTTKLSTIPTVPMPWALMLKHQWGISKNWAPMM